MKRQLEISAKTLLLFCIIFVCTNQIFAQEVKTETLKHIQFKGTPIDGNIQSFIKKLENMGYTTSEVKGNIATLKGDFAGFKDCELLVVGSRNSNIVWKVKVYLPKRTTWSSLKREYSELKDQYVSKYDKGKSYEFFSSPYKEGDDYEMQALRLEKCTFATYFNVEGGSIELEISKYGQIGISYEDEINSNKDTEEKKAIIKDQI